MDRGRRSQEGHWAPGMCSIRKVTGAGAVGTLEKEGYEDQIGVRYIVFVEDGNLPEGHQES